MAGGGCKRYSCGQSKAASRGADVANGAVELLGPIASRPVSARQIRESELKGEIRASRMRSIELRTVCKKLPGIHLFFLPSLAGRAFVSPFRQRLRYFDARGAQPGQRCRA